MNKSLKKIISAMLILTIIVSALSVNIIAGAEEENKVRVIVRNDVFTLEEGAPWYGTLVDEWVNIDESSTMMTAVIEALEKNNYSQKGAESGFIDEINGIGTSDAGFMSGWMGTLNDWFTNEGFAAYTVEAGTLESGDEICILYSKEFGSDVGGSWSSKDTSLKDLSFVGGSLTENFDPSVKEYTLSLDKGSSSVVVTPTAANKYYQVKVYKNEYTPEIKNTEFKRSEAIEVGDGDKIIIGVGDKAWPSMNQTDGASIYTITVKADSEPLIGDVNFDGRISILDATAIQKHLANLVLLSDEQFLVADFNNDGRVSILDATAIQKKLAGLE